MIILANVVENPNESNEMVRPNDPIRRIGLRPTESEARDHCKVVQASTKWKHDDCGMSDIKT